MKNQIKRAYIPAVLILLAAFLLAGCGEFTNFMDGVNVSYEDTGETTVKDQFTIGYIMDLESDPVKTGYTFIGWYTDRSYETAWDFNTDQALEDTILYAKWEAYVTYDSQSATTDADPTVQTVVWTSGTDTVASLPAAPEKAGYTFDGWWTEENGGGTQFTGETEVTGDITVCAKWVAEVTYDQQSATTASLPERTLVVWTSGTDTVGTLPSAPERTDYTFSGWWTEEDGGGTEFLGDTEVTGNITVYAEWDATVTYDSQSATTTVPASEQNELVNLNGAVGGAGGEGTLAADSEAGALPSAPARTGYTFADWWTAASGGGEEFTASTTVTDDITVYAKWNAVVSYDSQSADTNASPESETVVWTSGTDTVTALPTTEPSKTGYTFAGWWTEENGGGTQFTGETEVTGDITVYAKWTAAVTYSQPDATTDSSPTSQTVVWTSGPDTVGALPSAPERTDYTFSGWWTEEDGEGTQFLSDTAVTGDITVYAEWNATVGYDSQSASAAVPAAESQEEVFLTGGTGTLAADSAAEALPSAPEKTGYTFDGWWTAVSGGGEEFTATTTVTDDITVYAKWEAVVSYDSQSATTVVPASEDSETIVWTSGTDTVTALPTTEPSKTGYTFAGWWTAENGNGTEFTASTPVTGDITVYAKWTATVTFNYGYNAGSITTGSQYAAKDLVWTSDGAVMPDYSAMPADPSWSGYTFDGWYTEVSGEGTEFTEDSVVTGHTTVYAKWYATISFDYQSATSGTGTASSRVTWTEGTDTVASLPLPSKSGYSRGGWYTSRYGGGSPFTTSTAVTGDRTVYAKWYCTINFYKGMSSNTYVTSKTVTWTGYYDHVSIPSGDDDGDWDFDGWWTASWDGEVEDTGGSKLSSSTYIRGNDNYYAHYDLDYTVTLDRDGNVGSSSVYYGQSTVEIPQDDYRNGANRIPPDISVPSRTGYTFDGYYTEEAGSGIQIYNAQGEPRTDMWEAVRWTYGNGNSTLYAKWQAKSYSVFYHHNYYQWIYTDSYYTKDTVHYDESYTIRNPFSTNSTCNLPTSSGYEDAILTDCIYTIGNNFTITGDMHVYFYWDTVIREGDTGPFGGKVIYVPEGNGYAYEMNTNPQWGHNYAYLVGLVELAKTWETNGMTTSSWYIPSVSELGSYILPNLPSYDHVWAWSSNVVGGSSHWVKNQKSPYAASWVSDDFTYGNVPGSTWYGRTTSSIYVRKWYLHRQE